MGLNEDSNDDFAIASTTDVGTNTRFRITTGGAIVTPNLSNCARISTDGSGVLTCSTLGVSDLAASTSADLLGVLSDETGTGLAVFGTSPTIVTPTIASFVNATHTHQAAAGGGQLDHGLAITGLTDDDHTQYALLAGRAGGQVLIGGTGIGDDLTFQTTSNASKGSYIFSELDCSGNTNGGAITASATGVLSCTDDDTGGGGFTLNVEDGDDGGTNTAVAAATANFEDQGDINFVLSTSTITALVRADSVALTTDTTGNYVQQVADGTGIDGSVNSEGGTYTPTLDLTEVNSVTFGDNTLATVTHTVDPTGTTNPVWSYSDGVANLSAGALQEGGNAVPNVTDNLSVFAATTSAQLAGVLSDETGTGGGFVRATGPTISGLIATTTITIPNDTAPTTTADGHIGFDNNALTASRGQLQIYDGVASTYAVATLATDAPATGEGPIYQGDGTFLFEPVTDKIVAIEVFGPTTANATGDGKIYFPVPDELDGFDLVDIIAQVVSAGTTGTLNVDLARCDPVATGNACSGTVGDMLSTNLTIDTGENKSSTAAAAAVIAGAVDDIDIDDIIRIDIDAVHTTPAQGLTLLLTFSRP
jgi:hypothetical protein